MGLRPSIIHKPTTGSPVALGIEGIPVECTVYLGSRDGVPGKVIPARSPDAHSFTPGGEGVESLDSGERGEYGPLTECCLSKNGAVACAGRRCTGSDTRSDRPRELMPRPDGLFMDAAECIATSGVVQ
jgi:hypothetical protein